MTSFNKSILCVILFCLLTPWAQAKKKRFIFGFDGGYVVNQNYEMESQVTKETEKSTEGTGLAYGAYLGYYLNKTNRVRVGGLMFPTVITLENADYKPLITNYYFYSDYDFIIKLSKKWAWTIGAHAGYAMSYYNERELKDGTKEEQVITKDKNLAAFAFGGQLGLKYQQKSYYISLDGRYNFSPVHVTLADSIGSIKNRYYLPSSIITSVSLGFLF